MHVYVSMDFQGIDSGKFPLSYCSLILGIILLLGQQSIFV